MATPDMQKASVVDTPLLRATFRDLDERYSFAWGDTVQAVGKLLAGVAAGAVFGAAEPTLLASLLEGGVSLIPALQGQVSDEGRAFDLVRRSLGLAWAVVAAGALRSHDIPLPAAGTVVTSLDAAIADGQQSADELAQRLRPAQAAQSGGGEAHGIDSRGGAAAARARRPVAGEPATNDYANRRNVNLASAK